MSDTLKSFTRGHIASWNQLASGQIFYVLLNGRPTFAFKAEQRLLDNSVCYSCVLLSPSLDYCKPGIIDFSLVEKLPLLTICGSMLVPSDPGGSYYDTPEPGVLVQVGDQLILTVADGRLAKAVDVGQARVLDHRPSRDFMPFVGWKIVAPTRLSPSGYETIFSWPELDPPKVRQSPNPSPGDNQSDCT